MGKAQNIMKINCPTILRNCPSSSTKTYQVTYLEMLLTVKPCAINSSGTSSGRNCAAVTHGHFVFTGRTVTIISPLPVNTNHLM